MPEPEISQPKEQRDEFVESIEPEVHPQHTHNDNQAPKQDNALKVINDLGDQSSPILTPQNNTHVLRKIDLRLLPLLLGIYFLQQLDKTTLSYASVFGLIEKANLHGQQYSWLGSVVYLAQLVVQPLVAYILVKVPLGKFLACTIVLWGIALSCMTASNDFAALLVCRMFLGAFEAGIRKFFFFFQFAIEFVLLMLVAPAFIAITQMWYRRLEQPVRLGSWYAMNGVVNMVS